MCRPANTRRPGGDNIDPRPSTWHLCRRWRDTEAAQAASSMSFTVGPRRYHSHSGRQAAVPSTRNHSWVIRRSLTSAGTDTVHILQRRRPNDHRPDQRTGSHARDQSHWAGARPASGRQAEDAGGDDARPRQDRTNVSTAVEVGLSSMIFENFTGLWHIISPRNRSANGPR